MTVGAALATTAFCLAQLVGLELRSDKGLLDHLVKLIGHALFYAYLLKGNVRTFFRLETMSRAKASAIFVAVSTLVLAAMTACGFVYTIST